jgi:transposase
MSGKKRKHVQGRRGESYVELIRDVPQDRIVCVSIDVHKYFHLVMIHNGYGEILVPAFRINIFRSGFEQLCAVIDEVVLAIDVQVLLIGMEPTGHYFKNVARHLLERYPHVRLVNSYAVKENRNQNMLRGQKTDEIDVCAIGDLVLRNRCFSYQPLGGAYLQLQQWVRFRTAKVKMRTALRNQVIGHLDRIFPGLVRCNKSGPEELPRLFPSFWDSQTAQHLLRVCPDPRRLVGMEPSELMGLFHAQHWRMGLVTAGRVIRFAQHVLVPHDDVIDTRLPLLDSDLALLDAVGRAIVNAEAQIAHFLAQTEGQILTRMKGIGPLRAAAYIAGIGNPNDYEHAGQTFKRSGLISGRKDSGVHQRRGAGRRVTKAGDPHLRCALVGIALGLCQWQPCFRDYKAQLIARGKHPNVATVATARKVNGVLFALLRDQAEFDPRMTKARTGGESAPGKDKEKRQPTLAQSKPALSMDELAGCRSPQVGE